MFEISVGGESNQYWKQRNGDLDRNGEHDRFPSFLERFAGKITLDFVLLADVGSHCRTCAVSYHVIIIWKSGQIIRNDRYAQQSRQNNQTIYDLVLFEDPVPIKTDQNEFLYLGSSSYCFGNRFPAYAMSNIFEIPPNSIDATLTITTNPLSIHINCQTSVQITAFIPPKYYFNQKELKMVAIKMIVIILESLY